MSTTSGTGKGAASSLINKSGKIADFDTTGSPVGVWNFAGNLSDESGNAFDLTVSGDELWTHIHGGVPAAYKNSGTTYTVGSTQAALQVTGDLTIHAIISIDEPLTSTINLVTCSPGGSDVDPANNGTYILDIGVHATDSNLMTVGLFWETGTGTNVDFPLFTGNPELSLGTVGEPFMLSVTRDGGVVQFYLNGKPWGSPSAALTNPTGGTNGILILGGKNATSSTSSVIYKGVKIMDSAQTDAEVLADYNLTMGPAFGPLD